MKKRFPVPALIMLACLLSGCEAGTDTKEDDMAWPSFKKEKIVGKDVKSDDVSEFYYTYSNINLDAYYQRFYFHAENGAHYFTHETRERPGDYGPATEEDVTLKGSLELTDEQWSGFFELVSDGIVRKREESADAGDSGPWAYLYWNGDGSVIQEYTFASQGKQRSFEEYCTSLRMECLGVPSGDYPVPDGSFAGEWKCGRAYHFDESRLVLGEAEDGIWPVSVEFIRKGNYVVGGERIDRTVVNGTASVNEEGLLLVSGSIKDEDGADAGTMTAVLGVREDGIRLLVIDSALQRIRSGNCFVYANLRPVK
ncbi:MAG: hypothetical protein K6E50_04775 [Lachnospiraceae bacterium]|nr:hypothetical protein [Lachnospiraceae bacterium]